MLERTWRALFAYGLSFFIVAMFWFGNRGMMARVRRVDGTFSVLMLFFLGCIWLTPFSTSLMADYGPAKSMKVYSLLIGGTGCVQVLLGSYAAFWRKLIDDGVTRGECWLTFGGFVTPPLMFALMGGVLAPGVSEWALLPVLILAIALGLARRRLASRR